MQCAETRGIPLPEGIELSEFDRELVAAIAQTIAGSRHEAVHPWRESARRLEAAGWKVDWRIAWVAEARKGATHEQAVGHTLDEAYAQLWDLTLLDAVEGCP